MICFFFQAEDGIRDAQESRGLGDVYKRQVTVTGSGYEPVGEFLVDNQPINLKDYSAAQTALWLSLIHI